MGFETIWTFLLAASSQDWTGNLLRYLELDLVWILIFVSVLLNSLKPPELFHCECLYIQSRPHQHSELVVGVLLNWEKLLTAFASILLN